MWIFADLKVNGLELVPREGALIVVANHQSNIDPPLLGAVLPRGIGFLAKREIFSNLITNWFLRTYGAFPLNREGVDVRAYRWVLDRLEDGHTVAMFPEGTRNRNGMGRALPGVAQIALKSGAPILPIGITGTAHMGTWLRVFNPTGKIRVNIGPVFDLPTVEGRVGREVLESSTDTIMAHVARLLPENEQGVYRTTEVG